MKIKFVGDIHANNHASFAHVKSAILTPNSVQLGDLDLYGYEPWRFDDGARWFIDGNHDNLPLLNLDADEPCQIEPGLFHIPRGHVSGRVMFIGGAESIDYKGRVPGMSAYPEESLSRRQAERCLSYDGPVDVVVSHTAPKSSFAPWDERSPTCVWLDMVLERFRPSLWVFGHHHITRKETINGCVFHAVGILNSVEYDVPAKLSCA